MSQLPDKGERLRSNIEALTRDIAHLTAKIKQNVEGNNIIKAFLSDLKNIQYCKRNR